MRSAGLAVEDVNGKKVLDLGSGTSTLERGLADHNVSIISLDRDIS